MKCSNCYGENPTWSTVCSSCGQPVLRLEICSQGHLLPPGVQQCPICPSQWPDISPFAGPPLLRGLLWIETGRLTATSDPGNELAYLEMRDQESPLALSLRSSGAASLVEDDNRDVVCRILMRPEGVQVCNKYHQKEHSGPLEFKPLQPGEILELGRTSFRLMPVRPPVWVEKLVEGV